MLLQSHKPMENIRISFSKKEFAFISTLSKLYLHGEDG